ncbi:MAG TPA: lipoyl synthase [Fibrobacteres bacterium]|nr:lipoyl synthase [Fibrobacterota bacterium]
MASRSHFDELLVDLRKERRMIPERKPLWLKARIPGGEDYARVKDIVRSHQLHTVCESANCPNQGECWAQGTATVMILGNTCTRGCRFCDVPKGKPGSYDREEPGRVAESVRLMGLKYVVITSVARDDLPDQGAEVWAETIMRTRAENPDCRIEVLIPDLQGRFDLIDIVLDAQPDVLNHNFETVERLQREVRGRANIRDTSAVLRRAKERGFITKTSLMLGVGETREELEAIIRHIADLRVDILTIGQYLPPSKEHLAVQRYVPPQEFDELRDFALQQGIAVCQSGPLVRSSYRADEAAELLLGTPQHSSR